LPWKSRLERFQAKARPGLDPGWKPVRVSSVALCGARRYIPRSIDNGGFVPQIREPMRAEVERLVEEIKQSVGLLRRHL
jgi:hypothetical protein